MDRSMDLQTRYQFLVGRVANALSYSLQCRAEDLENVTDAALGYAAKEYSGRKSPDGTDFEMFAYPIMAHCVLSAAHAPGITEKPSSLHQLVIDTCSMHRTNRNNEQGPWHARSTESQKTHFAAWSEKHLGVTGTGHPEKVLAATLYFSPWILKNMDALDPPIDSSEKKIFMMRGLLTVLNKALWQFDPASESEDFLVLACPLILAYIASRKDLLSHDQTVTELAPFDSSAPRMEKIPSKQRSTDSRRKKKKRMREETDVAPSKGDIPLPQPEIREIDTARSHRVVAYVSAQVQGRSGTKFIEDAESALSDLSGNTAKTLLIKHLRTAHGIAKARNGDIQLAAPTLLQIAISTFDPPDSTRDHFRGHLQHVINVHGLARYQGSAS